MSLLELSVTHIADHLLDALRPYEASGVPGFVAVPLLRLLARYGRLDDANIKLVCSPDIMQLRLGGYEHLTSAGLGVIAQKCPNVTDLDLSKCRRITDEGTRALAVGCPRLQWLALDGVDHVSTDAIDYLAARCSDLKGVSLNWCRQVASSTVSALAENCGELRELQLWQCKGVSSDAIEEVAMSCVALRHVNLRGCLLVSDGALGALGDFCSELTSIVLEGCVAVTNTGLRKLIAGAMALRAVNVSLCPRVGDEAFDVVPPELESLHAAGTAVGDKTLQTIAAAPCAGTLRALNVRFCQRVTDAGLVALFGAASALCSLDIEYCPGITGAAAGSAPATLRAARGVLGGGGDAWAALRRDVEPSATGAARNDGLRRPASAPALGSPSALDAPAPGAGKAGAGLSRGGSLRADSWLRSTSGAGGGSLLSAAPVRPRVLGALKAPPRPRVQRPETDALGGTPPPVAGLHRGPLP